MNKSAIDTIEPVINAASPTACDTPVTEDIRYVSDLLKGRFSILNLLAQGEDSSYYLARTAEHNSPVNLEVLSRQAGRERRNVELFCLRSRAASQLSHKNIISASLVERVGSAYISVSPYNPEHKTLRELLDRKSVLDVRQAVEIARQLASALDHAHRLGVLHLQLHPHNVLLGEDGAVLVAGFGIDARDEFNWAHRERSSCCPVQYQSPEQMSDSRVSHLSDLYSLGILLFEMLTDRVPFNSLEPDYIKRKRLTQTPWPPHSLCEEVPEPLSYLVLELLKSNPDERIQSAAEFLSALENLNSKEGTRLERPVGASVSFQQSSDNHSSDELRLVIIDCAQPETFSSPALLPDCQPPGTASVDEKEEDLSFNSATIEDAGKPRNYRADSYKQPCVVSREPVLSEAESEFLGDIPLEKRSPSLRLAFILGVIVCMAALTFFIYRGNLKSVTNSSQRPVSVDESMGEPTSVLEGPATAGLPSTPELAVNTDINQQARKRPTPKAGANKIASSESVEKAGLPQEGQPSSTLLVAPLTGNKSATIETNNGKDGAEIMVRGVKAIDEMRKGAAKMETTNGATSVTGADRKGLGSRKQKESGNFDPR